MTVTQIKYFLAVAREMSFSKAADSLYVSQPAVSRQVNLLEEELDVKLFIRNAQGIAITQAGREFESFFASAFNSFNDICSKYRNLESPAELSGSVNIGWTEGWDLSTFFPDFKKNMKEKYPELKISLTGFNLEHIVHALERGEADIIITNEALLQRRDNISASVVSQRRAVLLFSKNHPLACKKDLALADFRDETFYVTTPQSMREAQIEIFSICADAEFVPEIEFVNGLSPAMTRLSSGSGVFLCNDWMMACSNPLFNSLPLHVSRNIAAGYLKDNDSVLLKLVLSELKSSLEK